jgi:hypothetical protein
VSPEGDVIVAWERDGRIEARVRRYGHSLGRTITVGRGVRLGTGIRAAITSTGRYWLAWASQSLSEGGSNGPFELQTAVSKGSRPSFERPRLLDRYEVRAPQEATFDLSLDPDRQGMVAWSGYDGQNYRARLATLDRRGRSARITTLSEPGYHAAVSDLATSLRPNEALVVWSRLDALGEVGDVVQAGYLSATGAYGGEERVSIGDRARAQAAAFDPLTGFPTAVWFQREGPDAPGVPIEQIRTFVRASTRTP